MGTRYFLDVTCSVCGERDEEVYYAPTCGVVTWTCKLGHVTDLEDYSGISYDDASNREEIEALVKEVERGRANDKEN